jgi:hypothetical protein
VDIELQEDPENGLVRIGIVEDPDHPGLRAAFRYEVSTKGLELVGVAVSATAPLSLTVGTVRHLPLGAWEQTIRQRIWKNSPVNDIAAQLRIDEAIAPFLPRLDEEPKRFTDEELIDMEVHSMKLVASGDPRFNPLLVDAARAYLANLETGVRDPVGAIARARGVKPSTARAWIFRARKAGLLAPTAPRTREPKEA